MLDSVRQARIGEFVERVWALRYGESSPLSASYVYDRSKPIPIDTLSSRRWRAIEPGSRWGELFGSGWFRFQGAVPKEFRGREVVALVDVGSEGCVFVDGSPVQGLTDMKRVNRMESGKRRVMLHERCKGGEKVDLLVEAGANQLFGAYGIEEFVFEQADVAVFNRDVWQIGLDLLFLQDLMNSLPETSAHQRNILDGLNRACNMWRDGDGRTEVAAICSKLLSGGHKSAPTTVWSVGHAHLDLAWLWPFRETRRKAGRTFATALTMMDEYPEYVFGASQPQAYEWVKRDYPKLYERIRKRIAEGRWECQGATWVEPDVNLTGGESLVRQFLYGKRFYRDEFGVDVTNLWLPDVFGYSGALPQLMKLAGVTDFMTQKLSWNDTNEFPHHIFQWEGIDGSRVRAHMLPMNTYNGKNTPAQFLDGQDRFRQSAVTRDWLNLFGIGDGGGGPSRRQIEFGLRAAAAEALPELKMARAKEYFESSRKIPDARFPVWRGDLYAEVHRGVYTTQARMKKLNRRLEQTLRDAEFLAVLAGVDQRGPTTEIWKDTLLNQFHDVLPGSSITAVYDDANRMSEENLRTVQRLVGRSLDTLHGTVPKSAREYVVHNSLGWERRELVTLPQAEGGYDDGSGVVAFQQDGDNCLVAVTIPAMGFATLTRAEGGGKAARVSSVRVTKNCLENRFVRVRLAADGTFGSIIEKITGREVLAGPANQLLLWEDRPYYFDAWEVTPYYRETKPAHARLVSRQIARGGPLRGAIVQTFSIGTSTVRQQIELDFNSALIRVRNHVDWREEHRFLQVHAATNIRSLRATFEIQFGTIERSAVDNTSWDEAQFEVPGHRFCDFSQPDRGIGIVTDCKYGYRVKNGDLDLSLLRSPRDPDPLADIGEHEFVFGYYPHAGTWHESGLLEVAHQLNSPPIVRGRRPGGPSSHSEISLTPGPVVLDTVKTAEDGEGVIVRLYESRGTTADAVLGFARRWGSAREVNLLEEPVGKVLPLRSGPDVECETEIRLSFSPYQIRSILVKP